MYRYIIDGETGWNRTDAILRVADSATIPSDPSNRDWVDYQAWLAEGNTPEEAE